MANNAYTINHRPPTSNKTYAQAQSAGLLRGADTPPRWTCGPGKKNHLSTLEVVWRQSRQKTGSTDALKVSILQKLPKIIQNKEHPYQKKRIWQNGANMCYQAVETWNHIATGVQAAVFVYPLSVLSISGCCMAGSPCWFWICVGHFCGLT